MPLKYSGSDAAAAAALQCHNSQILHSMSNMTAHCQICSILGLGMSHFSRVVLGMSSHIKELESSLHLLLDLIVKLMRNDCVSLVLAAYHVHTAAGKGIPRKELQRKPQPVALSQPLTVQSAISKPYLLLQTSS